MVIYEYDMDYSRRKGMGGSIYSRSSDQIKLDQTKSDQKNSNQIKSDSSKFRSDLIRSDEDKLSSR